MKRKTSLLVGPAGLLACTAILVTLAGCYTDDSGRRSGYQGRTSGQIMVSYQDDYDYYPGYETYYSRNRHEYVYRDGNQWVRRSEPRGISVELLFASPSVRMDFRDSPEQHHATVVRSYPRNWRRSSPSSSMQVQAAVTYQDDYDYYPGYETYYSRNRHEYVYRDGNQWVRRPEPRGISASVLLAAPSVRVDFRDSPEQHHATVVRSYPRDWKRQDTRQEAPRKDAKQDKKDRKDDDRDDGKDDRRRD